MNLNLCKQSYCMIQHEHSQFLNFGVNKQGKWQTVQSWFIGACFFKVLQTMESQENVFLKLANEIFFTRFRNVFVYLKDRAVGSGWRQVFHLLVYSTNGCNSQAEARNFIYDSGALGTSSQLLLATHQELQQKCHQQGIAAS